MPRVAAAEFSWGGMSNVLAASKDPRINALVCMDGAVRYYNSLMVQAKYAEPEKLKTPLLFPAQSPASMETNIRDKEDKNGSLISRMTNADVYLLTMYPRGHVNFGSSYMRFDDPAEWVTAQTQKILLMMRIPVLENWGAKAPEPDTNIF